MEEISFYGSYIGLEVACSYTQTLVKTNHYQPRRTITFQRQQTNQTPFGFSVASNPKPPTNNNEIEYTQHNFPTNNQKHIVLTGDSESEIKNDTNHSKMIDRIFDSVEQYKRTNTYKTNGRFTISTPPNYRTLTKTEESEHSQKDSLISNPQHILTTDNSEAGMAKDDTNSLSTVLKVKSTESQAHPPSETMVDGHGLTYSEAINNPKSYIPLSETEITKPKSHADINLTHMPDQKTGEDHKNVQLPVADIPNTESLEEPRQKFAKNGSKTDAGPQANHQEFEPEDQASKQLAGHAETTGDQTHVAHTLNMGEPKAVEEKLHQLSKPAQPEFAEPIKIQQLPTAGLDKNSEVDTHTNHLKESQTKQEMDEKHKYALAEVFEPEILKIENIETEEEKLYIQKEKAKMLEQRKKTADIVKMAVTEVVDKLSGVVAKKVVLVISQSALLPPNTLLPIEMAMAKFGGEWAPKLGQKAYDTIMDFDVDLVKNQISLIRERGNLKKLAEEISGKAFEVSIAFLMQKLGEYSGKLAKKYVSQATEYVGQQLQRKISGLGMKDLGEEANKLILENQQKFQAATEKAIKAFNFREKIAYTLSKSRNEGSKFVDQFKNSVTKELGLDTPEKMNEFIANCI